MGRKRRIFAAYAAVFMAVFSAAPAAAAHLTDGEREMIADLLTAECAGEPLAARISIAGIILDCEDSAADAIRALAAEGKFSETDSLGGADRGTKEYRISLDAVDGALAGCRPAGEVREFERVEQRLDLSLDFTGREEQDGDGVRIGSYVFR